MKQTIYEEILRFNLLSKYDNSKTLTEQAGQPFVKFPCVSKHPGAKETKLADGTSAYLINGVYYYGGGRKKLADGTMANYTCNDPEFGLPNFPCVSKHPGAKPSLRSDGTLEFIINGVTYYGNGRKMLADGTMTNYTCKSAEFKTWTDFPCVAKHPKAKETKLADGTSAYEINGVFYYGGGRKKLADGTMANYTCNDPEFKTNATVKPVATPTELKDITGIKKFQDWLDTNAVGWATGYKDGIINKGQNGGGYGSFGKRTQKAWATYKTKYLETPAATTSGTTTSGVTTPATTTPAATTPDTTSQQGNIPKYGQTYMGNDQVVYNWNGTEYVAER
jgi:hypothetical protein